MAQYKNPIDFKKRSQHRSTLKDEVNGLLKGVKKYQKARYAYWEEVVGEKIGKVAVPVKNKKGVLFVKVEDSVWRFELTRRKEELITKINEFSNKSKIKDIVFI
jgi:predicted nucleic acid-binding Zn ribbon protein